MIRVFIIILWELLLAILHILWKYKLDEAAQIVENTKKYFCALPLN